MKLHMEDMSIAEAFIIAIAKRLSFAILFLMLVFENIWVWRIGVFTIFFLLMLRTSIFYSSWIGSDLKLPESERKKDEMMKIVMEYSVILLPALIYYLLMDLEDSIVYFYLGLSLIIIGLIVIFMKNSTREFFVYAIPTYFSTLLMINNSNTLYNIFEGLSFFALPLFGTIEQTLSILWMDLSLMLVVSVVLELLYAGYLYRHPKEEVEPDNTNWMWSYFLTKRNWKKIVLLALLLIVAAFYEELIYRYLFLNIMVEWDFLYTYIWIPIIISSAFFGYAHKDNGGWFYVTNSFFAGIIFCHAYLVAGLNGSWILHLVWNALIVTQMLINILMNTKRSSE